MNGARKLGPRPAWIDAGPVRRPTALMAVGALVWAAGATAGPAYLRGGIGLDQPAETAFADSDCSSASPAALYGCGRGGDGAPTRSVVDFAAPTGVQLGVGIARGAALRLEALVEYRPQLAIDGETNFLRPGRRQSVSAELASLSAMFAAYVDLPRLRFGPCVPFVGAGVGAARMSIGATRMDFPRTTTVVPGGDATSFAWMLSAGFALPLGESAMLDLAWRYEDAGEIRTGEGRGEVIWRDGSREPLVLDLAETRADFQTHGARLSFRFAF